MNKARPLHEDKRTIFQEAKDAGFPLRAFKTVVKNHLIRRKAAKQIANNEAALEADDAEPCQFAAGHFFEAARHEVAVIGDAPASTVAAH